MSNDGEQFHIEKAKGLSPISFATGVVTVARHDGHWAQPLFDGGWRRVENVQPLSVNFAFGNLAVAHNGNLINATMLRSELEAYGAIFQSTSDTEVIIHLIAHSRADTLLDRVIDSLTQVRGAFSVVIMTDQELSQPGIPMGFGRSAWDVFAIPGSWPPRVVHLICLMPNTCER